MTEKTLLLVDDEGSILNALKRTLRREGYRLLTANNPLEGMEILEREPVALVLSDHRMPEMTGAEFLQKVKGQFPDVVRIVLSGYAEASAIMDAINKGEIYRFIPKPWDDDELRLVIRQALEHAELQKENERLTEHVKKQNEQLTEFNQSLEKLVSERTAVLELAQEILEGLPDGVMGITLDGTIAILNEMAQRFFVSQGAPVFVGASFLERTPTPILQLVRKTMLSGTMHTLGNWDNGAENWQLVCFPLNGRRLARGAVLMTRSPSTLHMGQNANGG